MTPAKLSAAKQKYVSFTHLYLSLIEAHVLSNRKAYDTDPIEAHPIWKMVIQNAKIPITFLYED